MSKLGRENYRPASSARVGRGRTSASAVVLSVATLALLAAGCGSSAKTSNAAQAGTSTTPAAVQPTVTSSAAPAPAEGAQATQGELASIGVESEARLANGTVAKRYTCKGADESPPVSWSSPPPGTKEQAFVVRTLQEGKLTTNWIIAGISPEQRFIRAGQVPKGAIVGLNSYGHTAYSLCPVGGKAALVIFGIFAFKQPLGVHPGFEPGVIDGKAGTPGVAWGSLNLSVRRTGAPVLG